MLKMSFEQAHKYDKNILATHLDFTRFNVFLWFPMKPYTIIIIQLCLHLALSNIYYMKSYQMYLENSIETMHSNVNDLMLSYTK